MTFMMAPENTNEYAAATGQVPAVPNAGFTATDSATSLILKAQAENKTAPLTNQMWPNPQIVPAQRTATQQMLGGSIAPVDVAKAMDQAWNQQ